MSRGEHRTEGQSVAAWLGLEPCDSEPVPDAGRRDCDLAAGLNAPVDGEQLAEAEHAWFYETLVGSGPADHRGVRRAPAGMDGTGSVLRDGN
jgi:hypothetical protein